MRPAPTDAVLTPIVRHFTTGSIIKHTADGWSIHIACMNAKANNLARVLIDHDHDPAVFKVIDSARNKSTLHRLSLAWLSVVGQEGPRLAESGLW